jgi:hypothetical protein
MRLPMRRTHHYNFAFGIAMAIAAASAAHANLIVNFGFEEGMHTNDGNNTEILSAGATDITGWTVIGSHVAWIEDPNPFGLQASDGIRFLDLTGYTAGAPFGGVTQTIATTPGLEYQLTFALGTYTTRWGGPPVGITASAGSTSLTFTDLNPHSSPTWTVYFVPFTATDTSTVITLVGSAGVNYIGLDSVDVECISSTGCPRTGVPEPATLSLLGLGLAILGITRRRDTRADPRSPSA